MPTRAVTPPPVPDDALARQLAIQSEWLAGAAPSGARGLEAVVVGELDWTDFDEEWHLRATSAKARVDVKTGRAELVAELRADHRDDPAKSEARSIVLAELPLLHPDGTIATSDRAIQAEWSMVRTDGPWPGLAGPGTFGLLARNSAYPLRFRKRPRGIVVQSGDKAVALAEIAYALSTDEVNPYTPTPTTSYVD